MENFAKKLEEQITFLQQEISQISNELYSQQKENLNKRIEEVDGEMISGIIKEDKKPPHY
jgi:SlyX protein